jgi:hypothetical protein
MSSSERFARLSKLSLDRHDIEIALDWRYQSFFDYLQVSPSYRLAHLVAAGRLQKGSQPLPADFEKVQKTYDAFGSVYRTYFGEWWLRTAQYRFGVSAKPKPRTLLRVSHREEVSPADLERLQEALDGYISAQRPSEGLPATLIVAIPISKDRARAIRDIKAAIDKEFGNEKEPVGVMSFKLLENKIRERTLDIAMRVLLARTNGSGKKLYQVGNHTKIAPQYWTDETRRRRDEDEDKRRKMEIVTARHLRRAYLFAENAARGRFPSLENLPADPAQPAFDYPILRKQLWDYVHWGRQYTADIRAKRTAQKKPR